MFRNRLKVVSFAAAFAVALAVLPATPARADAAVSQAVSTAAAPSVTQAHPRILLTKADVQSLTSGIGMDVTTAAFYAPVKQRADALLAEPVIRYSKSSGDLQPVSRELLNRAYALGTAFRVTGDVKYADRLWRDIEAASNFPDWNPAHFLDTAELAHAFAITYDWMHGYLSAHKRSVMKTAIESKAFKPAISAYTANAHWTKTAGNWNIVVNSALGTAALSFDDLTPDLAREVLTRSLANIKLGIGAYGSDGSFTEGITYWAYATNYITTFASALQTSTGSTQGLLDAPGIARSGQFVLRMSGPSGQFANFGDAWSNEAVTVPLLALEAMTKDANLRDRAVAALSGPDAVSLSPQSLIWLNKARSVASTRPQMSLDAAFKSFPVATLRGAWGDRMATGVTLKGGTAGDRGHEDLDAGTFTLDALGERWATDLGADSYKLPGYFALDTGQRWDYYKKRAEGHNRLVVNPGRGPDSIVGARAEVNIVRSDSATASAITDLSATYAGSPVTSWRRGVSLFDGRSQTLVQDEVNVSGSADIWWFMHTPANITLSADGRTATLRIRDKQMEARLLEPTVGRFVVAPAKPLWSSPAPSGQDPNASVTKLALHLEKSGSTRIAVQFTPKTGGATPAAAEIKPLDSWSTAAAAPAALTEITVAGVPIQDFSASKLSYNVEASSVDAPPRVAAKAASGTTVSVSQAAGTPGRAEIKVSATGRSPAVYSVYFHPGEVTVNSVTSSTGDASLVRDRRPYTYWTVQGTQSLTFDLGERRTVQHAEVDWRGVDGEFTTFKFEVSDDQASWRKVFEGAVRSHTVNQWSSWTTGALKSRYVRLTVYGAGAKKTSSVSDLRLFSEANYVKTAPKTARWQAVPKVAEVSLNVGETGDFGYTLTRPAGTTGSDPARQFFSTNTKVATVDSSGRITAVAPGVANVGVRFDVGGELVYAATKVTVKNPDVLELTATRDGYVQGGDAWNDYTFRNAQELYVKHSAQYPAFDRVTYLGFDLSGIPAERIVSATLSADMRPRSDSTAKTHVAAFTVSGAWSEAGLTFNNRPRLVDRVGSVAVTGGYAQRTIDVTDAVRGGAGKSDFTLGMSQDATGVGASVEVAVHSRRTITPPKLTVRLSDAVPASPRITSAVSSGADSSGRVAVDVQGAAGTEARVDLWQSTVDRCPSSRGAGELLTSGSVVIGGGGTATTSLDTAIAPGSWLFATVVDEAGSSSRLSDCTQPTLANGVGEVRNYGAAQSGHVEGRGSADVVYNTAVNMLVKHSSAYPEFDRYAFVDFNLSDLGGASIEEATLTFRAQSPTAATHLTAFDVRDSWNQNSLSFNTRPRFGERVGRGEVATTWSEVTIDVTDLVRRKAGGIASVGFSQDDPGGDAVVTMNSHRSSTPPRLSVTLRPYERLGTPALTSVFGRTSASPGKIEGTVAAPAGTAVSVQAWAATTCVTHSGAAREVGRVQATADTAGIARFSLSADIKSGEQVIASATASGPRSSDLSDCTAAVPTPGVSEEVALPLVADTFVHGGDWSGSAFPTASELQVKHTTAYPTFDRYALLEFDTRAVEGRVVESATLEFTARSTSGMSNVDVASILDPWDRPTVTFNTRPRFGGSVAGSAVTSTSSRVKLDVTEYFRDGGSKHGFVISQDGGGTGAGTVVIVDGSRTGRGATLTVRLAPRS